jgi:hypothetical protein
VAENVKAKLLCTPIKLITLGGLLLLIYILRGVMIQDISYEDMVACVLK